MADSGTGGRTTPGADVLEPRADAIERYWQTIEAQIAFLEQIDDKSQRIVRYTALLVGIVVTAVTFVSRTEAIGPADTSTLVKLTFIGGVGLLLVSIGLAAYTSLDSVLRYGLGHNFGYRIADGTIQSPKYERIVLNTYASVVGRNRKVINVNARRFQHVLLALLVGLIYVSLSGLLVLVSLDSTGKLLLSFVATVAAGWIVHHVSGERYLVLERKR